MINRKKFIKNTVMRAVTLDVVLLAVLLVILIGTPIQAFVTGGGITGVFNKFSENPQRIIVMLIVLAYAIDIVKKIVLSITFMKKSNEFFDSHPFYNQREASVIVNKYIEVVDKYIFIMSRVPYIINVEECSRFAVAKQKSRLIYSYYSIDFIDRDGEYTAVYLPKLKEHDGSAERLIMHLNKLNKYDNAA